MHRTIGERARARDFFRWRKTAVIDLAAWNLSFRTTRRGDPEFISPDAPPAPWILRCAIAHHSSRLRAPRNDGRLFWTHLNLPAARPHPGFRNNSRSLDVRGRRESRMRQPHPQPRVG